MEKIPAISTGSARWCDSFEVRYSDSTSGTLYKSAKEALDAARKTWNSSYRPLAVIGWCSGQVAWRVDPAEWEEKLEKIRKEADNRRFLRITSSVMFLGVVAFVMGTLYVGNDHLLGLARSLAFLGGTATLIAYMVRREFRARA